MATYCYTTNSAEDDVLNWFLQHTGLPIDLQTLVSGITRAWLLDQIRTKATADALTAQESPSQIALGAIRSTLTNSQRQALGL